jgi:hypothetical protein
MSELGRVLSENILISIVSGLAVVALTRISWFLVRPLIDFLRARRDFTLTGTWIGTCVLRSYRTDAQAIEIYYLKARRSNVTFTFFNYRPDISAVRKHTGGGTRRDCMVAAYYSFPSVDSRETGVFLLKARKGGNILRGMYAQYDLNADEQLTVSGEDFELRRIRLPFMANLRIALGRRPVRNYAAALSLFDRAGFTPRKPTVAAIPQQSA